MWSDGPINNFGVCLRVSPLISNMNILRPSKLKVGTLKRKKKTEKTPEKNRKILPYDNEIITKPGKKGRFFNNPIT